MLTKKNLKNALVDGVFYLPWSWVFYSEILADNILGGEQNKMGSDLACQPMFLSEDKKSLLISLMDTKFKNWYAWVHAEDC